MNFSKNKKSKFSISMGNELKSSIDEENDEDDLNQKPLLDEKDKINSKRIIGTKTNDYYELSKQNCKNVNEMNYDEDDEYDEYEEDDDDDYKDEETNEQTQLTRPKKKQLNYKKSIRNKLFGSSKIKKQSLSKQSSTENELNLGKIKILIPRKKNKGKFIRYKIRKFMRNFISLFCLLGSLIVVFILLYFKRQYLNQLLDNHSSNPSSSVKRTLDDQSKHCDMLIVNNLWNVSLPKLIVGQQLRLLDVNNDDTMDILVPFSTTIDQIKYDPLFCQIYFNQTANDLEEIVCGGGLLLLDGRTGEELWRVYSKHGLNWVNCLLDLDLDGINDCFATGPKAQLLTINGRTGKIIWKIDAQQQGEPFRTDAAFHTPLLLPRDINRDGLFDIIVMHGGDYQHKSKSASARLICLSPRDGSILLWSHTPDGQDSFVPPTMYYRNQNKDSDTIQIIYGTGGFDQPGSLWSINLDEFLSKNTLKKSTEIYKDCCKGILTPPILIDLNKDNIQDIVIAFNSTVAAFNGRTFVKLWYMKLKKNAEFFVSPSVGYFDDDDVPDFIVQYEVGDSFANTYYSEVQVLSGRDGKMLLKDSFKMLTGSAASPITISLDTNDSSKSIRLMNKSDQTIDSFDIFLFWQSTCENQDQELEKLTNNRIDQFKFKLKFDSIDELKKTDFCKLRFNKNIVNRMHSLSFGNIMTTIYDSNERLDEELKEIIKYNWTKQAADYLAKNSDLLINYMNSYDADNSFISDNKNEQFMNSDKRNSISRDSLVENFNKGFYLPGLKQDYLSLKKPNDYTLFSQQDKNKFNLADQPNYNLPNDNLFMENNLANLLNEYQQQKLKLSEPFHHTFNLKNTNNANKLIRKKSSPYDNISTFEKIFQHRSKRTTFINKHIHKIYTTPTLAPSKSKNNIDVVFASNLIPDNGNVKLIKKLEFDNCLAVIQKSKEAQTFLNGNLLNELINYCDNEMKKNDQFKKWNKESMINKQMGSSIIYRNSLKCKNGNFYMKAYNKQIWPAYMGISGNGMANI